MNQSTLCFVRAATEGLTYFLELSGLITGWPTTKAAGDSTYHLTETVALVTAPLFCFLDCESNGPERALYIGIDGAARTVNKYLLAASFDIPATSNCVTNLNGSFVVDEFEHNPLIVFLSDNPSAAP